MEPNGKPIVVPTAGGTANRTFRLRGEDRVIDFEANTNHPSGNEAGARVAQGKGHSTHTPPVVSVITAVRNAEDVIERTIRSVVEQTYNRVEYVVVDGASTDRTPDIIRAHADRIDHWVSEPDRGHAHAFNKGIDLSTGDTLIFMNAGDTFNDAHVLERVVATEAFTEHDVRSCIVYGDAWVLYEGVGRRGVGDHTQLNRDCQIYHQATFIGRDVHQSARYDERVAIGMDYELWLRCYNVLGVPFHKVDEIICTYPWDGISAARSNQELLHIENEIIKILNSDRRWTFRDALRVPEAVVRFRIKKGVEAAIGRTRYARLKKLAGR